VSSRFGHAFWLPFVIVGHSLVVAFATFGGLPVAVGFSLYLLAATALAAGLGLSSARVAAACTPCASTFCSPPGASSRRRPPRWAPRATRTTST
jgi:hypothetical protein